MALSANHPIDLRLNYPLLPGQASMLRETLQRADEDEWEEVLRLPQYEGPEELRRVAAEWLSLPGYPIAMEQIVVPTGGHHAVLVALLASRMPGSAIAVDPLTYPGLVTVARLLQIQLLPCAGDSEGMLPDTLRAACRQPGLRAVYLMPTVHNPLGTVMPLRRREEIISVAREHGLLIFEDDAYGFLDGDAPPSFGHLAPDIACYIYSLSKPVAPGVRTAFLCVPHPLVAPATEALRISTSGSVPLLGKVVSGWLRDGTVSSWIRAKRGEGKGRQDLARKVLSGIQLSGHPSSYHLWLTLPDSLRAEEVTQTLAARGVSVVPAVHYAVTPAEAPNALRVSLGGEMEKARLAEGLAMVASLTHIGER